MQKIGANITSILLNVIMISKQPGHYRKIQLVKGIFCENQMLAKIHIIIPVEKQIISALENYFPFVDRTSQTRDLPILEQIH